MLERFPGETMGCFRELGTFTIPNKNGAGQVLRGSVQRRFIVRGCAANGKTLFVHRSGHSHESPSLALLADASLAISFVYQSESASVTLDRLSHPALAISSILSTQLRFV